jgi:hypothetical protein
MGVCSHRYVLDEETYSTSYSYGDRSRPDAKDGKHIVSIYKCLPIHYRVSSYTEYARFHHESDCCGR